MTPWVTVAELKLFRNVSQVINASDDNADGNPDTGILKQAVDAANNFVDGYLGLAPPGFPQDKVQPALKVLAANIALHIVFSRNGITDETAKEGYDDAFIKLKEIISQPVTLVEDSAAAGGPIEGNKTESDLDEDIEGMAYVT